MPAPGFCQWRRPMLYSVRCGWGAKGLSALPLPQAPVSPGVFHKASSEEALSGSSARYGGGASGGPLRHLLACRVLVSIVSGARVSPRLQRAALVRGAAVLAGSTSENARL